MGSDGFWQSCLSTDHRSGAGVRGDEGTLSDAQQATKCLSDYTQTHVLVVVMLLLLPPDLRRCCSLCVCFVC